MVVVEKYPELKSDQNFRDLQAQLEGTENRITVARNRYIQAVQALQRHRALVPDQPHGDAVRLQGQAELHGRERSGDRPAAHGRFHDPGAGPGTGPGHQLIPSGTAARRRRPLA